jgi:hypothetical protein
MFIEAANQANTKGNLLLQPYGGNVGIKTTTPSVVLHVDHNGDISSETSMNHGFQVGPSNGAHMAFDTNEIQARNNGSYSNLYLNYLGGNIYIASSNATTNVQGTFNVYKNDRDFATMFISNDDGVTRVYPGSGNTDENYTQIVGRNSNNDDDNAIAVQTGNLNRFLVKSSGRIVSPRTYDATTSDNANVRVTVGGILLRGGVSSKRYKTDIETIKLPYSEDIVYNSRPVWYRSLCENDRKDWSHWGFIAEEVSQIDPRLVDWGFDKNNNLQEESVFYNRYIPHICNVLQKQKQEIENLTKQLSLALNRITELES